MLLTGADWPAHARRVVPIEHLDKELRAQALISEESRSALVRAESAYADAAQRLTGVRREASEAQGRAHAPSRP